MIGLKTFLRGWTDRPNPSRSGGDAIPIEAVTVVEYRRNPSTDYFVLPRSRKFGVPIRVVDSSSDEPTADALGRGTLVVFVRYIPPAWCEAVDQHRDSLAGVSFFMDDDLFDLSAHIGLPRDYLRRIKRFSFDRQNWLRRTGARFWFASPYLADKYRDLDPELLQPVALDVPRNSMPAVRFFYHGTASHGAELQWLRSIVHDVQQRVTNTYFEVIGDHSVNRLYRDIPRVMIVHPMSWERYREHCLVSERQIGLAPLLPGSFNAARSHTKFFDITRCGAVGIYSNRPPFSGFIRDGEDGLLCEDRPQSWVEAIRVLATDPERRARLAHAARLRAMALADS